MHNLHQLKSNIAKVVKGKEEAIHRVLTVLLAGGHLLIEDVPGVGKTTLAQALANSLGCAFQRIQFTADMLPSDLIGVSIFNQNTHEFEFKPGPLFTQVVLADEINRTSPRTQSALLEAMNERQITVNRETHPLKQPFFVMATQNPLESYGTYPLPDSQLDRFLMRIRIGYPDEKTELEILKTRQRRHPVNDLEEVLSHEQLSRLQAAVDNVQFDDSLQEYLYALVKETRTSALLSVGVSTRGALLFHRAVRAYALVQERDYVLTDDIKTLAIDCLAHRITPKHRGTGDWNPEGETSTEQVIIEILSHLPVPL